MAALTSCRNQRTHAKHVILFLAANPEGTNPLHRDDFRFESRWAVGIDELMRHLMELDPT